MNKRLRLPNGYGTVHKLSNSDRRRKPWRVAVPCGETETGQVKYRTLCYTETDLEGLRALQNYNEGIPEETNITLEQLYKEWSCSKYKRIEKSTVDTYKAAWKHVEPLKHSRFSLIRSSHWQDVIDGINLSRSSLHKIKTLAVMLSDYAVQNDIVNKNHAKYITLPKWKKIEKEIFTDAEIKKMFESRDKWVDTVIILIYTGLRINELLKLTRLQINEGVITTGSKTDAGNRIIPIHDKILPMINSLSDTADSYIVTEDGNKLTPDVYRKRLYYPALEKAGVARKSPHSCRHTFASILKREGVDNIYIQRLLGHANYAFTADTYTHPEVKQLQEAISKLC